jgi:hypothetical protein
MEGNYIKIGNNLQQITQPELWAACESEEQYFRILREQQRRDNSDKAARQREAFIAGKFYFLTDKDTDFFDKKVQ